jgi:hypothetical protein
MNKVKIILAMAVCVLACAACAQDTNSLRTKIGLFEAQTGVVIIKGISPVGLVPLGAVQLSVGCKESKDVATGQKLYGLIIEVEGSQFAPEAALVDDDEAESLLNAVNYLAKIGTDVTVLPGFEATYTTKAGLRVIAESLSKNGAVSDYLEIEPFSRFVLSPVQMTQFAALVQQGLKSLDDLKAGKPPRQ